MAQPGEQAVPVPATTEDTPSACLDLETEIAALRSLDAWQRGKAAKRLTAFANLRVSLMLLAAGESLGEHHNPGRVSIQPIRGHLRVIAGGKTYDAPPGKIVFLDRDVPHDVQAIEESAFLVTVALENQPH